MKRKMDGEEGGDGFMEHMEAGWKRGGEDGPSFYWMGNDTHKVPRSLHAENRKRMLTLLDKDSVKGLALMMGGKEVCRNDSDHEPIFRQESNFHYLFGVAEPDCYATIDTQSGATTLFIPRLPAEYAMWMGAIATPDDFKKKYEVQDVRYVDEMPAVIKSLAPDTIFVYEGINSDSKAAGVPATFDGIDGYNVDRSDALHTAVYEARVVKSEKELELMRYVNKISSDAHISVMRKVRPSQALDAKTEPPNRERPTLRCHNHQISASLLPIMELQRIAQRPNSRRMYWLQILTHQQINPPNPQFNTRHSNSFESGGPWHDGVPNGGRLSALLLPQRGHEAPGVHCHLRLWPKCLCTALWTRWRGTTHAPLNTNLEAFHDFSRFDDFTCDITACLQASLPRESIGPIRCRADAISLSQPNNRKLTKDRMVLNDMGNEYYCYSSDITVSFPVSGKFTPEQKGIYEAVLDATLKVRSQHVNPRSPQSSLAPHTKISLKFYNSILTPHTSALSTP
jgi:hypothetical protein